MCLFVCVSLCVSLCVFLCVSPGPPGLRVTTTTITTTNTQRGVRKLLSSPPPGGPCIGQSCTRPCRRMGGKGSACSPAAPFAGCILHRHRAELRSPQDNEARPQGRWPENRYRLFRALKSAMIRSRYKDMHIWYGQTTSLEPG